ncbi:MAG: family efflux transporter, subunit [Hydrocarboniphaga sp.]|uniref:efflux RND transporter periplasmic adaptor subunit n=1 Tax=Hydrocarboniphaga sp. TaxID=2033016 RepID=UPI002614A771|nr:efflux RND transporter periplasmic adaptor subunit [Hydrocarboniphaga sp.]MDB5971485.1 family efflux transporter, subunit [Hydrocarboniphaga sp.]
MRQHKAIAVGLLSFLVSFLALTACKQESPHVVSPRPVAVISPTPQDKMIGEIYPGSVRARVESPLSFRVSGKFIERHVDVGARVKKGQVLAVLDPVDARLNVEASKAAVGAAEADTKLAESEYLRYQDLAAAGFVSRSLLDQRGNELDLAKAKLEQARSQLAVVRNQAGYTNLLADADGIVTDLQADAGQVVSAGQAVFGFARDGEREISIAVPEGTAVDTLRRASALRITLWAVPNKVYEGRVREIAAAADKSTRTYGVRISLVAADDDVKIGMTANVAVGSSPGPKSWRIPLSAVGDAGGNPVIWRVSSSRIGGASAVAEALPVQVLQYLNDSAIVVGDIKPGERVISSGVQLLRPGMPIEPIDRGSPAAL